VKIRYHQIRSEAVRRKRAQAAVALTSTKRNTVVTPDYERARLAGFLALHAQQPPDPAWEESITEVRAKAPPGY
jgi:hypothetical protein